MSLQSCPTLCDPIDSSPPGSPRPWDSPGKNTGVGCHFLLQCMECEKAGKPDALSNASTEIYTLSLHDALPICAKSLQSCPTLCNPIDSSPPGSPRPWDSPGKNTGVGCHFLLQCMKVKSESEVAQSCPTLRDRTDCSLPGSSAHGIFQARVLEWGAIAFSHKQLYL